MSDTQSATVARLRGRAQWVLHALAVITALAVLASDFAGASALLGSCLLLPVLGVAWLVLLVRATIAHQRRAQRLRYRWLHWCVAPCLIAAAFMVANTHLPLRVAFAVSKPTMERMARDILAAPPTTPPPGPRRLGLFSVDRIERFPGGVRFYVAYGHWLDRTGFAYNTEPLPAHDEQGGFNYRFMEDHWHEFWK